MFEDLVVFAVNMSSDISPRRSEKVGVFRYDSSSAYLISAYVFEEDDKKKSTCGVQVGEFE